jgi:hypothetical protein
MNNSNNDKKQMNKLAFWGPYDGQYGGVYSSKPLDAAAYDQLMKEVEKLGIGARVYLNVQQKKGEKSPSFILTVRAAEDIKKTSKPRSDEL